MLGLSQDPDEHSSESPVFLAVGYQLGEGAALRVAPELADPFGPLEVGRIRTWRSSACEGRPRVSRRAFRRRSSGSGLIGYRPSRPARRWSGLSFEDVTPNRCRDASPRVCRQMGKPRNGLPRRGSLGPLGRGGPATIVRRLVSQGNQRIDRPPFDVVTGRPRAPSWAQICVGPTPARFAT